MGKKGFCLIIYSIEAEAVGRDKEAEKMTLRDRVFKTITCAGTPISHKNPDPPNEFDLSNAFTPGR